MKSNYNKKFNRSAVIELLELIEETALHYYKTCGILRIKSELCDTPVFHGSRFLYISCRQHPLSEINARDEWGSAWEHYLNERTGLLVSRCVTTFYTSPLSDVIVYAASLQLLIYRTSVEMLFSMTWNKVELDSIFLIV